MRACEEQQTAKLAALCQAIQESIDSGPPEPLEDIETLLKLARAYHIDKLMQATQDDQRTHEGANSLLPTSDCQD